MELRIGECFILGFRGPTIPLWLTEFEKSFGLGGVILFDYDVQTKQYRNNIDSPAQLTELCRQLHSFASRPLIFIDQEGGKVRRLKEKLGFAPLPSQKAMVGLSQTERESIWSRSFSEMKQIGIDVDLAPVVDLDLNPLNPDIGAIERSYSPDARVVRELTSELNQVAVNEGIGLCLKHYPGLGGATTNSHTDLTDLSEVWNEEQLELFFDLAGQTNGNMILLSHGTVKDWDAALPVSISDKAIMRIRKATPDSLLLSDDLHMKGLQLKMNSEAACLTGFRAGLDMALFGNNLLDEQSKMFSIAEKVEQNLDDKKLRENLQRASHRIVQRKNQFRGTI